jgi:ankyrin repeat protein
LYFLFDQVVDYLVDKMEYDVNQQTSNGTTSVKFALENNYLEVVKVLLRHQASVGQKERALLAEIDNPEIQEFLQQQAGIKQT